MSDDFLKYCIEYFGESKQQVVCIEEMAELTQQLSKFVIDHKNKSREKVVEEYIDVLIMLNQMKIIFGITDEEVENGKVFKLARLKKFIDSHRTPRAADGAVCDLDHDMLALEGHSTCPNCGAIPPRR